MLSPPNNYLCHMLEHIHRHIIGKRLARKQMGWFGRDPRIHWLHALNPRLVDNAMAVIDHADAGDYDPIDAQADEYTQHHLGDLQ